MRPRSGGVVFVSNTVLPLCLAILLLLLRHNHVVLGSEDVDVLEGGGAAKHDESIGTTTSTYDATHELRRLVIRHMDGENAVSRLEDLGFVVEATQEEISYVVRGGSESAIEELRLEGVRVARRPTSSSHQEEHFQERKRSDARKARIQLTEVKHQSIRDAHLRSAAGNEKQARRKQWKTPTNAEDTARRLAGGPRRKRQAPISENATLKQRASRDTELREAARQASSTAAAAAASGPFSKKKGSPFPLRKPNAQALRGDEQSNKLSSGDTFDDIPDILSSSRVKIPRDSVPANK